MANRFLALVLYDCDCDMDHKYVIKSLIITVIM